jgi:hypothetical protein
MAETKERIFYSLGGRMPFFGKSISLLAAIAVFLTPVTSAAQSIAPPPLSAYGSLPEVESAAISPSGRNIAVLTTIQGKRMLLFLDQDRNLIRKLGVDDIKVRYFDWVGDDRLLLVSSQTQNLWGFTTDKLEMSVGQIIPVTYAGEIEAVFGNTRKLTSSIFGDYGVRNIGGQWYGFFGALELRRDIQGSWVFDHGRPYLYQVDLSRNSTRGVGKAAAPGIDREWVVAANGTIAATFDMDTADGDWELSGPDGGVIASGNHPTGRAGVNGLGYDGSTVIYYERDEEGIAHSFEVPLAGGKPVPFLPDAEIERIYRDDATGHIIGYLDENEGPVFANPAHSTAVSKIRKAFRKYDMRMVDWTPNFEKVLVRGRHGHHEGQRLRLGAPCDRAGSGRSDLDLRIHGRRWPGDGRYPYPSPRTRGQ